MSAPSSAAPPVAFARATGSLVAALISAFGSTGATRVNALRSLIDALPANVAIIATSPTSNGKPRPNRLASVSISSTRPRTSSTLGARTHLWLDSSHQDGQALFRNQVIESARRGLCAGARCVGLAESLGPCPTSTFGAPVYSVDRHPSAGPTATPETGVRIYENLQSRIPARRESHRGWLDLSFDGKQ